MKKIVFILGMLLCIGCDSNSDDRFEIRASCIDGIQNGNETGIDCGGDCEPCGSETAVLIPNSGYDAPNSYAGYNLVWNDEFDGENLSSEKWSYNTGNGCPNLCFWGNNELQYFTDSTENLYLQDGNLIIKAQNELINGQDYSSARINTDNKFEFQYGRIDIRAAMPKVAGTWTALFMLNKEYSIDDPSALWPSGGEIDIMEYLGEDPNDILGTAHYGSDLANHNFNSVHYPSQNNQAFDEVYYVYSIVWEENSIKWLVNNVEYHSITPSTTSANQQAYPFNDQFYLILALSVGGNLPNATPIPEDFPAYLIIDYIRVYQ